MLKPYLNWVKSPTTSLDGREKIIPQIKGLAVNNQQAALGQIASKTKDMYRTCLGKYVSLKCMSSRKYVSWQVLAAIEADWTTQLSRGCWPRLDSVK